MVAASPIPDTSRQVARLTRARQRPRSNHGLGASSGFTLAEALIASVVLAIAVVGLAGALSVASSQSHALDADTTALALGRQLMEEVLARPFDPPAAGDHGGWNTGNHDKNSYDDIADYDGYSDVALEPSDGGGATMGAMASPGMNFNRSVSFTYRATPGGAAAANGDFGMITVTVTPDAAGAGPVTLHRLVSRVPLGR